MPTYKNPGMVRFTAKMLATDGGGVYVDFPFDVEELFGVRGRVPIQAEFESVPYRGSLAKMSKQGHILIVRKDIRQQLGKEAGEMVEVSLWLDTQPRVVELPDYVKSMLDQNPEAMATYDKLSYSHQREHIQHITSAKREDTRVRRALKMIEMLTG